MTPFPYVDRVQRRFSLASDRCILDDPHLWIHDRDTVVRPGLADVGGVHGFFFPPVAGGETRIAMLLDGERLPAGSFEWRPGQFVRGAFRNGLDVRSSLVAVAGGGFVLTVKITNAGDGQRRISLVWQVDPEFGVVPSSGWGWPPPQARDAWHAGPAGRRGIAFTLDRAERWCLAVEASEGFEAVVDAGSLRGALELSPRSQCARNRPGALAAPDRVSRRLAEVGIVQLRSCGFL